MAYLVKVDVEHRDKGADRFVHDNEYTLNFPTLKSALLEVVEDTRIYHSGFVGRVMENGVTNGWAFEYRGDYGPTMRKTITFFKINVISIPIHPLEVK